ncbi:AAA family ATPase [Actinoplanes sp. CA-131856]
MRVVGRQDEVAGLSALLDRVTGEGSGGSLVLRGDAGVGKSTLLGWAVEEAGRRGFSTIGVTGVQAEFGLAYAGLHRLLGDQPLVRAALDGDQTPVRVALALLTHLTDAATEERPLLVVADDAHWLDGPSWDALTFVARRLAGDPVLILMAMRTGAETTARLTGAGLPESTVLPLDETSAAQLLDRSAPALRPEVRARVLAEAAGNPLGLVELAAAGDRPGRLPEDLPLPVRLERSFALSVAELPAATRTLLLVAALNEGTGLHEIVTAATSVEPGTGDITADDLTPAVAAGLVQLDGDGLRFRHPLIRSALRQTASAARRRRVHAALGVTIADGERSVRHRAAAADAPDEALAAELEQAAQRDRLRGALAAAVAGLERAGQLSEDPEAQARRLMWAVFAAYDLGDGDTVRRLMNGLADRRLPAAAEAQLAWLREAALGSGWSGADRVPAYLEIIERLRQAGDQELALSELTSISLRCYWSNPDAGTIRLVIEQADRFDVPADNAHRIAALAMAAPLDRGPEVVEPIARLSRQLVGGRPEELDVLATAASGLGAFPRSLVFARAAADELRAQGRLGVLAQTLTTQATVAGKLGDVRLAEQSAVEARSLAVETGQPRWAVTADLARAHALALRGEGAEARRLADAAESALLPVGAHPMLALVQLVRGADAMAEANHAAAFEHLAPIFDPGAVPFHPVLRFWALTQLADAAMGSGREADLRAVLDSLPDVDIPVAAIARTYTRALLEEDFTAAIDPEWPFERARLQHAYGAWLRRKRRVTESRLPLRAAISALTALGCRPWADRAQAELRATGESTPRREDARDRLTPQELQIAMLAADGLTNRDIGQRLFLSPRTIGTHLYRIFPKLGVASRTELVRALMT